MELSFTAEVNADRNIIWSYYVDINKRRLWEEDLEYLNIEGKIQTGATGVMKLEHMPEMNFTLTDIRPGMAYWDRTEVPERGFLIFGHDIMEKNGKIWIKHSVRLDDPTPSAQDLEFLKGVFADVPEGVLKIKAEAEK